MRSGPSRLLLVVIAAVALGGCHGTGPSDASVPASPWVTAAVTAPGVAYRQFESAAARTSVSYHVYLPPQYLLEPTRRFPVLYWLHGTGGQLTGIAPISAHFDAAIRAGHIPPMLVVFANGMTSSMWADSKDGRIPMETVVARDLVDEVDARFRTLASRDGRLLEGFSMGGYGVARIGLRFPERFGAISALAGGPIDLDFDGARARANPAERNRILAEVYGNDLEYYRQLSPLTIAGEFAASGAPQPRIRIVIGDADDTRSASLALHHLLDSLDIPHEYAELRGVGHNMPQILAALGAGVWPFYSRPCALSPTPPSAMGPRSLDSADVSSSCALPRSLRRSL